MPSEMVGSAYAKISLDSSALDSGMSSSKGKFTSFADSLEAKAKSTGAAIGDALKVALMAGSVAAAGAAVLAVKSYGDIESAAQDAASKMDLSSVAQKSGQSVDQAFSSITEHVIDVSRALGQMKDNSFTPQQVADSMAQLAAGGFDVAAASANDLNPILQLATANHMELSAAATTCMSTMNQWGMKVTDLGHISDVYTMAGAKSAAQVNDFSEAMKYAGPVAKALGLSFEDTTASIAELANQGYQGEMSGTALRTGMLALGDTMNQTSSTIDKSTGQMKTTVTAGAKALQQFGLSAKDVDPNTHNFLDSLKLMRDRGMGVVDFEQVFGKEAAPMMYALSGSTDQTKALSKELNNCDGYGAAMATRMNSGVKAAINAATGAVEDLSIALGDYLKGPATDLANWIGSVVPGLETLGDAISKGDWTTVGDMISSGIQSGWSKLEDLGGQLYDKIKGVNWRGLGDYIYKGVQGGASELWSLGAQLLAKLKSTNWGELGKTLGSKVAGSLTGIATTIYDTFSSVDWDKVAQSIIGGLKAAYDFYSSYYSTIGTEIYNAISKVDWSTIGTKILASLKSIGSEISGVFTGIDWGDISGKISTAIKTGITGLTSIGQTIWDNLNTIQWGQLGESAGEKLGSAVKSALNILSSLGNTIKGYVESGDFSGAGTSIADKIKGGIATVTGWMDRVKDGFLVGWGDTGSKIANLIKEGIATVSDWASSLYSTAKSWIEGAGKPLFQSFGKLIVDAIGIGIASIAWATSEIGKAFIGLFTYDNFKAAIDFLSLGVSIITDIGTGIMSEAGNLGAKLGVAMALGIANALDAVNFDVLGQNINLGGQAQAIRDYANSINIEPTEIEKITGTNVTGTGTYSSTSGNINLPDWTAYTQNGVSGYIVNGKFVAGTVGSTSATTSTPTTTAEVTQNDYTAQARRLITGQTSASSLGTQTANAGYTKEEMLSALEGQIGSYGTLQQQADLAKTEKEFSDAYDAAIAAQKKTNTETTAAASDLKKVADMMPKTASDAAKTTTGAAKTVANMMPQSATTAGEVTYKYSKTAAEALTLGGGAVQIGLTASGQELAVIGTVAQQNFTASGGKFVSDTSTAGEGYKTTVLGAAGTSATTTTGAATASASTTKGAATDASATTKGAATTAAGQTTGASSVFQGKVQSGAQIAMDAISKAGDPATKLVIGAQYAAQMIVSAGNVFMDRVGGLNKNSFDVGGYASGTETSGPELALIGEAGKEFVIPTKKKRWDLLLAAMKAYGIRGFAEGGAVGSGSSDADVTKAVASIAVSWDVGKLVSNTEKQLKNLQDYFSTTWSLIKLDGQKAWQDLGISIPASVGVLRATLTAQMLDIKNVTIQTWTDLQAGIKGQVADLWPTIQPTVIQLHDNIIGSFTEVNSVVSSQMDSMKANVLASLQAIVDEWGPEFSQITDSLNTMNSSISTLSSGISQLVSLVQQLNSLGISLGGSGSGVSSSGSGSDSGGWLGTDSSQSASDSSTTVGTTGDITDMTCTGPVSINAGTYTSPTGQVTQFNPMTYNDTGLTALTSSVQSTLASTQKTIAAVQATVSQYAAFANSSLTGYNTPGGYAAAGGISQQRYGLNAFGDAVHSDAFASWGKYAGGGLIQEHSLIEVGESGPEMVLPTNLTKTILSLADAGLGSSAGNNGGMSDDRIVGLLQAALSGASITMDGEKVARIVFPKGIKIARNQGGMKTGL